MNKIFKLVSIVGFAFYLLVLTSHVILKYYDVNYGNHFNFKYPNYYWKSHNFIPFKTIYFYFVLAKNVNLNTRVLNILGNIIGFVPLGFMLPLIFNKVKRIKNVVIYSLYLSLFYETIQLLFKLGSFDIDDLILNTTGGTLGYLAFLILLKTFNLKRPS
ncbi:MAG: VanZ family protein [Bacillales bacterium]|jgi:glycopeptide antibiotics resistance protein|nr:VanZ family protein [Bacillales bacterium]